MLRRYLATTHSWWPNWRRLFPAGRQLSTVLLFFTVRLLFILISRRVRRTCCLCLEFVNFLQVVLHFLVVALKLCLYRSRKAFEKVCGQRKGWLWRLQPTANWWRHVRFIQKAMVRINCWQDCEKPPWVWLVLACVAYSSPRIANNYSHFG